MLICTQAIVLLCLVASVVADPLLAPHVNDSSASAPSGLRGHHRALAEEQAQQERAKQVYYHSAHNPKIPIPADADGTKYVALTFDDGPHQILTPRLLEILKEKNCKATFYVMGVKVGIHPDIVARAVKEGHEIGNHVYDHPVLTKIKPQELDHQIAVTADAIKSATGGPAPKTLRPPYGNTNRKVNDNISKKHGLDVIFWSYDIIDWRFPTPETIVEGALKNVNNGAIILAHDVHTNTINAMPALIDALQKEKYKFITVSELIEKNHKYTL
jgi:peptidoglycan/xylan/chitin deacetylase (PgdA/CDA1 family)